MAQSGISALGRARAAAKRARSVAKMWTRPRHYYAWHWKHSPVREDAVLFESFHGKAVSDSPLHMLMRLAADAPPGRYEVYYASSRARLDEHRRLVEALGLRVRLVAVESLEYARVLATAKYLVNNSSFPAYFTRRPEQVYLQTWHGTPLKTLGKQMRLGVESMYNVQHNFLQASLLTFPNEFTRDAIMRDYNLERLFTGATALVGYPRNDVFFDAEKAREVREFYGLQGVEAFAYMPTWRGANNYTVDVENYRHEVMGFLGRIDRVLRDDQMMFVNFHSMVAAQMGDFEFDHVFPFPATRDSYDFLSAMDVLVTDYSSVLFDFALTRRPIVLFAYDEEDYLAERGMYLDMADLPFAKAASIEDLERLIATGGYRESRAGAGFEERFLAHDSADNSAAALELLFGGRPQGVPVEDWSGNREHAWRTVEPFLQGRVYDVRTACEAADPQRDVVLFRKGAFDEDKSRMLHDGYRDSFAFLFATRAYNCTALEELLMRRSARVGARVARRENARLLPGLSVPARPVRDIYTGGLGTSVNYAPERIPRIAAEARAAGGGALEVRVDPGPFELRRAVIVNDGIVIDCRDLDQAERETGSVGRSVDELVRRKGYWDGADFRVILDGRDRETGGLVPIQLDLRDAPRRGGAALLVSFRKWAKGGAQKLVATAYRAGDGQLAVRAWRSDRYLSGLVEARLSSLGGAGGKVRIRATMRDGDFVVRDFVLRFRSDTDDFELPLPYELRAEGGMLAFDAELDPASIPYRGVYWDAFVVVHCLGFKGSVPVRLSAAQVARLKLGNQQWRVGADRVVFTHVAKGSALAFACRPFYPKLDSYSLRLKEFAALGAFALLHPYWKRKRVWLVYEKFCKLAQDNAYYFFEYCMSLPPEQRGHVYYVIDKSQPDFAKLSRYGPQVIDFMSFRHILYSMVAKLYIASDSKPHLYVWRHKPSFVWGRISKHKIFFLQHGVTAMKRVDYLFGAKGSSPMTYFLTTSKREQDIVVSNFGYKTNRAPVLGFSRWDVLEDRSSAGQPTVLLMPTWRSWLEEQSAEQFVGSEYFARYSSLINSAELDGALERAGARLLFFIHPKLSEQLGNFEPRSGRIGLVAQGSRPLNELVMECSMLVTDYSSVCWDVVYLGKPVVFYQFDQDRYEAATGSYIDLEGDLPGPVCHEEREVVAAVEACAARGFSMTAEEARRADGWFAHRDRENRRRTYDFIVDRGF